MSEDTEYILVTVSGKDTPGITANLMRVLGKHDSSILDMGQSVTHGLLSLSFLIHCKDSNSSIIKDLLFEAKKMDLTLDFKAVDGEVDQQTNLGQRFIVSCVTTERLQPKFLSEISSLLASKSLNILRIDNNSGKEFKSVDITTVAPDGIEWESLKRDLITTSEAHKVDIAFLKDNIFRRSKRLIVFDMDSTLIQTEVINEMAQVMGAGEKIEAITERAMNGEIDFSESLRERVAALKGLTLPQMQEILENLPLTPGVEEFIRRVKHLGYKVAVISGGFTFFANALKEKLGMDYAFANELELQGDTLTGKVLDPIVDARQKSLLLDLIAQQEKISLEQVVAVGDGANDLPMLSKAGLGIAFHAKDIVKKKASQRMSHGPMTSILYFLGITGEDI